MVLFEIMRSQIDGSFQHIIDIGDMKRLAAIAVAAAIEPRCDLLHPHRSSLAIAAEIEVEDLADQRCFAVVDGELLLVLVATTLEDDRLITARCPCSVPEAVPGIGGHRPLHMLAIFLALIFIERSEVCRVGIECDTSCHSRWTPMS